MSYKDLVVHLDSGERCAERLRIAVGLAEDLGARLTGLFAESGSLGASIVGRRSPQNMAKAVEHARERFEAATRNTALATDWWTLPQGEYADVISATVVCCRYVDLAIFGQHDPEQETPVPEDLVEQVLVGSGRPILVVPHTGRYEATGRRVLVAWTGSRDAARALNDAMPLLVGAQKVIVLQVQEPGSAATTEGMPPLDPVAHLRAHGVAAEHERVFVTEIGAADLILNRAADHVTDLTVLGGYSHHGLGSPLQRSTTTHDILRSMTTPVLLSH